MSQPEISFNTEQDKLRVITYLINKQLHEHGGEILLANAQQQTLERLDELDGETSEDQEELDNFNTDKFNKIINDNKGKFTINEEFGNKVTNVDTTGSYPTWLEMPKQLDEADDSSVFSIGDGGNKRDDLSEIECLTEHQPELLHEKGYNTFADIWQADTTELTEVAGIASNADARELKQQASAQIDAEEAIAWRAYERESADDGSTILGSNGVTQAGAQANKLSTVKVPAGAPRNPTVYKSTNIPVMQNGLICLKPPKLTIGVIEDYIDDECDTLHELIDTLSTLIKFDIQEDKVSKRIQQHCETLSDVQQAIETTPETVNNWITQPGVTTAELQDAIKQHADADPETGNVVDIVNQIDKELADSVPEQSRVNMVYKMRELLHNGTSMATMLQETTLEDVVSTSETPAEVDHPFIRDVDEFPQLRTRTMETGEKDIELVAKIAGKDNYAVDLVGHAGVGKDTMLKILAAATNRPMRIINMDNTMLAQELYGDNKIDEDGKIVFEDGLFPHAAKYGFWLVLSEVNAAPGGVLSTLHQAFEEDAEIHVKQSNEMISPSPRFRVAVTRNPPTENYNGMNELNDAFADRMNPVQIEYLPPSEEVELIDEMVNSDRKIIDKEDIENLVDMANTFREQAEGRKSSFIRLTPRNLKQIIDKYDGTNNLVGAAVETIRPRMSQRQQESAENVINRIEDHLG